MGVVTGEMLVDGRPRDQSFQRKTGYVQQQDLHLHTTTVREALRFSALLRQPAHVPRQEKIDYVEEVIKLLGMESYADAVVGVPGEGMSFDYCFCSPADTNQVSMSNNGNVLQSEWNSQRSLNSSFSWMNLRLASTVKLLGPFSI
jgi:hypothetical protein